MAPRQHIGFVFVMIAVAVVPVGAALCVGEIIRMIVMVAVAFMLMTMLMIVVLKVSGNFVSGPQRANCPQKSDPLYPVPSRAPRSAMRP